MPSSNSIERVRGLSPGPPVFVMDYVEKVEFGDM